VRRGRQARVMIAGSKSKRQAARGSRQCRRTAGRRHLLFCPQAEAQQAQQEAHAARGRAGRQAEPSRQRKERQEQERAAGRGRQAAGQWQHAGA